MAEPTKQVPGRIVINPRDPKRSRSWPDPARITDELFWQAKRDPSGLTREQVQTLCDAASAYAYIFSIPQRQFLPTHSAIRAHLAAPGARGQAENETEEQGHGL